MRLLYLFVLLLCFIPRTLAEGLPDLGEVSQNAFSPQEERRIGESIMRNIRSDRQYYDDAELTEYLSSLGYSLVSHSPDNRRDFEFFVIKDSTMNAFALPGGYIGVHTGLILAAQNESELAGVLSHEIAHITQRHLARLIAGQQQTTIPTIAALAIAILASRSNPQVASAAIATAQAASIQTQLDFTREHEREADRIGFQIMQQSGFDTHAMSSFFERLQKYNRVYENNAPEYLRTHPLTSDRIADMQNRSESSTYRQVPDSIEFQLMRAKLRALQGRPEQAVQIFEASLKDKNFSSEIATRYGLAYALMRAKNYARAEQELALLKKTAPANASIAYLAAQIKVSADQQNAAIELYQSAVKRFPSHRALIYGYTETLLKARRADDALRLTKDQLQYYPSDARLYGLQAEAYAAQGKTLLQHQSLAEAYFKQGNLTAAIEQLQIGLKGGDGDFYQLSIAESRLRELRVLDAEARKR